MGDWLREMEEERLRQIDAQKKAAQPPRALRWWELGYRQQQENIRHQREHELRREDFDRNQNQIMGIKSDIENYIQEAKKRGNYSISTKQGDYTVPIIITGGDDVFGKPERQVSLTYEFGVFTVRLERYEWRPNVGRGGYRTYNTKMEYKISLNGVNREHIGTWVKFAATDKF